MTAATLSPTSDIPPLRSLASVQQARDAFAIPLTAPAALPDDLAALARTIAEWDETTRSGWMAAARRSVFRQALGIGVAIADAIRLQRAIRTERIDHWLAEASPESRAAVEAWRSAFFLRCDALAALTTEGLVLCDLSMPEDGLLTMLRRNPTRIGTMIAERRSMTASLSVMAASAVLVAREWDFVGSFLARQLRRGGIPFGTARAERIRRRLNTAAGRTLLTTRHLEPLIAAYGAMDERGLSQGDADQIALRALQSAEATSGKPWKGLVRLYDLLVYSNVKVSDPRWPALFDDAMHAPISYTHVPGREWIVRDYPVGKQLLQIDGKIAPGARWASLQQGRSSLATGYLRGGQDRTEFGRRYSKPLAAFLDSMVVAEGPDHQRQRKAFIPFFTQAAVLDHAAFVEATVGELLDDAERVARARGGAFDLRADFAYQFPIRIICHVLGLPPSDVPNVQRWAEAAVRAMDTEAGLSVAVSIEGQRASDRLRAYLENTLDRARAGTFSGHVMGTVANDSTLSERERVANLGVLIFAGFETTTGLLSKGVEALLRHRAQWEYLRTALAPVATGAPTDQDCSVPDRDWRWLAWALAQPDRVVDLERRESLVRIRDASPAASARFEAVRRQELVLDHAIEELLRWTAPGTVVPLTASTAVDVPLESPMVVKGCPHAAGASLTIARGETVAVAVDELNRRCPVGAGQFDAGNPQSLDVSRTENSAHLSFGLRHSCIGAFLAKENAKRALEGLLRRFPDLELAGDPIPQEMELFSGLASLPVRSRAGPGQ